MTSNTKDEALMDHLYGTLSILDGKSSSMLTFNGIMLAVYVIYLAGSTINRPQFVLANLGTLTVLISSVLLLSVVWVYWSTTEQLRDGRNHYLNLVDVRKTRTIRYRLAWCFSFAGVVTLVLLLVVELWTRWSSLK